LALYKYPFKSSFGALAHSHRKVTKSIFLLFLVYLHFRLQINDLRWADTSTECGGSGVLLNFADAFPFGKYRKKLVLYIKKPTCISAQISSVIR
jgi:hypothetical protein